MSLFKRKRELIPEEIVRVFGGDEEGSKKVVNEIQRQTDYIHEEQPKFVIINMASAYGITSAMKQALKTAYPEDEPPIFLMTDPRKFKIRS